jgi:hypothetical protein
MKAFFVVILLAAVSYGQGTSDTKPRTTLDAALTEAQIDSVLKSVVSGAMPEIKATFLVTDESLAGLRSSAVSASFAKNVQTLKGQEIVGREKFFAALNKKAGEPEAQKYQELVAFYSHSIVVVTDDFYSRIRKLVLKATPPENVDAKTWLEAGFKQFMRNYSDFLRRNSPDKNTVVIGIKLEEFLELAASGCGKNPCDVPPCCAKLNDYCGDPCKD